MLFDQAARRQRRVLSQLDQANCAFERALARAIDANRVVCELLFAREERDARNPTCVTATLGETVTSRVVVCWVAAAAVIDALIARPTTEFVVKHLGGAGAIWTTAGMLLLPLAILVIDVGIGIALFIQRNRARGAAWMVLATLWAVMMPLLVGAAYLAGVEDLTLTENKLQLAGLLVISFCAHASLVFAGDIVHRGLELFSFDWGARTGATALAAAQSELITLVSEATLAHRARVSARAAAVASGNPEVPIPEYPAVLRDLVAITHELDPSRQSEQPAAASNTSSANNR